MSENKEQAGHVCTTVRTRGMTWGDHCDSRDGVLQGTQSLTGQPESSVSAKREHPISWRGWEGFTKQFHDESYKMTSPDEESSTELLFLNQIFHGY